MIWRQRSCNNDTSISSIQNWTLWNKMLSHYAMHSGTHMISLVCTEDDSQGENSQRLSRFKESKK